MAEAKSSVRGELWKAIIAVAVEESVRRFLPPLLPYVWFGILLGLTWEILNAQRLKHWLRSLASRLTRRWLVTSYILVGVIGAGVAVFYWWGVQKAYSALTTEERGFHVVFKTQLLDMSKSLDWSPFWVLYRSGYGDTVSPVALLTYLEITSLNSRPTMITSYSLALNSASGVTQIRP